MICFVFFAWEGVHYFFLGGKGSGTSSLAGADQIFSKFSWIELFGHNSEGRSSGKDPANDWQGFIPQSPNERYAGRGQTLA